MEALGIYLIQDGYSSREEEAKNVSLARGCSSPSRPSCAWDRGWPGGSETQGKGLGTSVGIPVLVQSSVNISIYTHTHIYIDMHRYVFAHILYTT